MVKRAKPLAYPIKLRDGKTIETLDQAVDLLKTLPHTLRTGIWIRALAELVTAQNDPSKRTVTSATEMFARALIEWQLK